MGELKKKSVKAIKWNTLAQVFNYLIKFTLGVFLARLLSPQEFGLVAMVTVITELSNFLIDGGFSGSLIQKKDIGIRDYSTVFYVNIALGVFFAFLIFFLAPVFVRFYNEPRLLAIARVISAVYILYSQYFHY